MRARPRPSYEGANTYLSRLPCFFLMQPISGGHKLGCPSDAFSLAHTNMFKLLNYWPTFKIGKCPVKVQTCRFFSTGNHEPACTHDAAGLRQLPYTQQGLYTLSYAQGFSVWPILLILLICTPLWACAFITFQNEMLRSAL